ncbi:hypothetical protein ACJRO7_010498 [Eucalyptus globulus]|uniref:Uncharacterized protein n=1 Tax=Eucalyptus globulus TaxID=34317 RepID=A0ABD3JN67_EUCGL
MLPMMMMRLVEGPLAVLRDAPGQGRVCVRERLHVLPPIIERNFEIVDLVVEADTAIGVHRADQIQVPARLAEPPKYAVSRNFIQSPISSRKRFILISFSTSWSCFPGFR